MLPELLPKTKTYEERSIILVIARMDSFSTFDNAAPGARSGAGNVVVMLGIAHALATYFNCET